MTVGGIAHRATARMNVLEGCSIEVTAKDINQLERAAGLLPPGTPISITYLANDSMPLRIAAAEKVRELAHIPVPPISARRMESRTELLSMLEGASSRARADRCFVIAGDVTQARGPFNDALAVIGSGLLGEYGVKSVGIAGYPEGHPQIAPSSLWSALHEKRARLLDLGLEPFIVTQFCFSADPVLNWIERVRQSGISDPIYVGVPGPANVKTLLRFAARCGVGASTAVLSKYGLSVAQLFTAAGPDRLIEDLAHRLESRRHGNVRIHFYAFGGLESTAEWIRRFKVSIDNSQ